MSPKVGSYEDFAQFRSQTSSCVTSWVRHFDGGLTNPSTIVTIDYSRHGPSTPFPFTVAETDLSKPFVDASAVYGRILLAENIQRTLISLLGEIFDLDCIFFASQTTTGLVAERGYLHLYFLKVLDLGTSEAFQHPPDALKTDSNIPRNVRHLPPLSRRQLALARVCCSMVLKSINDSWICKCVLTMMSICLVLVDPPGARKTYPSRPLHGGSENFASLIFFSSFDSSNPSDKLESWDKSSMLSSLHHYFCHQPPPGLAYYPTRIFLAEWAIYIHLMSRYFKHYEYNLHEIQNRLHDSDISDLQRWRRRSMQSQRKMKLLVAGKQPWDLVRKDVNDVLSQLDDYSCSLEQMIPAATPMVQLIDSQRVMRDDGQLVPLSWVTSLFSTSDELSPGRERFWVYFATSLPVLGVVLSYSVLPWGDWVGRMKGLEVPLRQQARRHEMRGGVA
ncbi:hypothetical protein N657DRAFT_654112 [Parathielavia appendiculata]|uniref:Uncharacterized protein n=1 Tax=Parathielavia appendiculata TaxID=2587402 RepID=A0AAN6Z4Y7_9PEZI|nr:hypothetical protein N657DRAFT_654112 [Parathielavia appendiculata]